MHRDEELTSRMNPEKRGERDSYIFSVMMQDDVYFYPHSLSRYEKCNLLLESHCLCSH